MPITVRNKARSSIAAPLTPPLPTGLARCHAGWLGRRVHQLVLAIEFGARKDAQQRDHDENVSQSKGEIVDHDAVLSSGVPNAPRLTPR